MHEVNPETVGQAIWLKDVNGNEIFEGDIVEEVKPEWDEPSRAVAVLKIIILCLAIIPEQYYQLNFL